MDVKLYQQILDKVKKKVNKDRYDRNLNPLTGETLNCIANRNIGIILNLVSENNKQYKEVLERIFMRYIPEVTEIMIDKERDNESVELIKAKFSEEIQILDEFLFRIQAGMDFKATCKTMSKQLERTI